MKIFVSYSSARRDLALRLKLALEAEGHDVFFDRDDLAAGEAFHQTIREAIDACELCIFLVSPESVAAGSYTVAELDQVQGRWPRPAGHVLPVVVADTPKPTIPPYLMAVTLLEPRGEIVAETLAAVARLASPRRGGARRWAWAGVVLVLAAAGLGWAAYRQAQTEGVALAERTRLQAEAARALALCTEGNPADAWDQFVALAAVSAAAAAVQVAQQDCAMHWLRQARVTEGHTSFEQLVAPLKPVLAKALVAGAEGQRAADLRAHLGWADYLVWRDGRNVSLDPAASYRQALQLEPGNVYGHAMWGFWLLVRNDPRHDEALAHFDAALQGGRERPFVRGLQLGSLLGDDDRLGDALRVLDQMRQGGEALNRERDGRLWSRLYARAYDEPFRRRLLAALPPEEGLKTFRWLFPQALPGRTQQEQWRLVHGLLLTHAGQAAQARPDLLALQQALRAAHDSGPFLDTVNGLLARP